MRSRSIWPTGQGLRKSISFRLAVATALGTLLLLATAVGASAEPPIEEKRVQAEAILAEVQALDEEVGAAAERYNGANYELQRLTARLATTRAALGRARTLLVVAQRRLEDRLRQLYMADDGSALEVIIVVAVLYIILGMFIDSIGLLLLTLPIILPMVNAAGMDLIWFGIIVVKLLEIGMVTPPVGLNVYVIHSALRNEVPLVTIFKGVMWFIVMDLIALALFVQFPQIALWLPQSLQ